MRRLVFLALLACWTTANAAETLSVCYNYGCLNQAEVTFSQLQIDEVQALLADALNAEHERHLLAVVIGKLLGWAGQQSPIQADRGGNFADDGVPGKMDCIDHATTTTRLLTMLAAHGFLRWHRVLEPVLRRRLVFEHWSAQVGVVDDEKARYAVDSWFHDNGQPAVVMPLDAWMRWEAVGD